MLKKNKEGQSFEIPGGTRGVLQNLTKTHSVALVEIDGVYPVKGVSKNDICTETLYLLEGILEVTCDGKMYNLTEAGDIFVIEPGHAYAVSGKGKALDIITPGWDKKQNHIIE